MAKHAYSFRDLLTLRYEERSKVKSIEQIRNALITNDCTVPAAIEKKYLEVMERIVELNSIRRDRFEASSRRQAKIGYGVEF